MIQILGYRKVWEKIFEEFGVDLNDKLASLLVKMDKDKLRKSLNTMSSEGKLRRNAARTNKIKKLHTQGMHDQADGVGYVTDIALKQVMGQVKLKEKSTTSNPKGTVPSTLKCKVYHERYC